MVFLSQRQRDAREKQRAVEKSRARKHMAQHAAEKLAGRALAQGTLLVVGLVIGASTVTLSARVFAGVLLVIVWYFAVIIVKSFRMARRLARAPAAVTPDGRPAA